MFSMCFELTPRARMPDTRIPQFMQPCCIQCLFLFACRSITRSWHHLDLGIVYLVFVCFLLRLSRIKRPQVTSMVKFSPTALNFGYDFVLSRHFLAHPVCFPCLVLLCHVPIFSKLYIYFFWPDTKAFIIKLSVIGVPLRPAALYVSTH